MNKDIAVFAETTFRNKYRKFGIKADDRRRHMYLIGKTGMGKSTILENMIVDDIRAGRGVAIIDPHGDLAEKVVKYIPNNRIKDVVYFNPADYEYPMAFNVVEQVEPHMRHLVASGLVGVFQKLWADSWGPRLEYILRNTILAILDYPNSTLLAVTRMLSDKKFRKKVVENIQDPVVKAFWVNEFAGYNDKFASEAVAPIQNKVGQFLSTSLIRNIVGQTKSTIDMREIMDEGKILILNLSKGRIGEDSSALLGAMIITKIQLSAMSRVDINEEERRDFYLYIDEFQNFTTDSFASILSEARKYRLNLIMAHQYIEQLGEVVRYAVFGNVGTLVVFRVGATDAEALEPEFTPTFLEEDILNLPKYEFYLKLMIDGIASEPFSARGIVPLSKEEETNNLDKIIIASRERYTEDRVEVEDRIERWYNPQAPVASNATQVNNISNVKSSSSPLRSVPKQQVSNNQNNTNINNQLAATSPVNNTSANSSALYKYTVNCSRCNAETKLSFKPDGVRPVFCKDCLSVSREEKKQEFENRKKAKEKELKNISIKPFVAKSESRRGPTEQKNEENITRKKTLVSEQPQKLVAEQSQKNEGISLGQALKMNPVNFKGKEISKKDKSKREVIISDKQKKEDEENSISPPVFKNSNSNFIKRDAQKIVKKNILNEDTLIANKSIEDKELEIEPDKNISF